MSDREERGDRADAPDVDPRSVLEAVDVPAVVLDTDGDVRYANAAVEATTGLSPDALVRDGPASVVHPEDREAALAAFAELLAGEPGDRRRGRYRLRTAGGGWRRHEVTFVDRLADPAVEGIVATATPASGADASLESAVAAIGVPALVLDRSLRVVDANGAAGRLFGVEVGASLPDSLPGTAGDVARERLAEALESDGVEFDLELGGRSYRLDARPVEDGIAVVAVETRPGLARDDRRRLRALESAIDAVPEGVLVVDGRTVRVANAAAVELLADGPLAGRELDGPLGSAAADELAARAGSPVVGRAEPVRTTVDHAGERVPIAVTVRPIPGDDAVVCLLRDERDRRATLGAFSALERAATRLLGADGAPEPPAIVVEAAIAALGADAAGWYRLTDGQLRPAVIETATADDPPPLPALDPGETVLGAVDGVERHDRSAIEPVLARTGIRADEVLVGPVGDDAVIFATTADPEGFDGDVPRILETLGAIAALGTTRLEDAAGRRDRERELAGARARLDELESLIERTAAILGRLVRATDREGIETAAVEELAAIDGIELVWIGESDVVEGVVRPRAAAGETGYLEAITIALDGDEPTARTATSRELTSLADVVDGPSGATWRREALDRGVESILSVPIAVGESVYGTLTLYGEGVAFDGAARTTVVAVGELLAGSIEAVGRRHALLADAVTELEFAVPPDVDPLVALAAALDRPLEVGTIVPSGESRHTAFVVVGADGHARVDGVEDGSDPIEEVVGGLQGIESVRPIRTGGEDAIELAFDRPTVATALVDRGAILRSLTPADGRVRLLVDLPQDVDVRAFVRAVRRNYPTLEPVARRERERPARTVGGFRARLVEELTDRQRHALEAAHYAGFFEWPRESTGEEVARSLGVSQPTFNRHFRAAQRKLFALLFGESDGERLGRSDRDRLGRSDRDRLGTSDGDRTGELDGTRSGRTDDG